MGVSKELEEGGFLFSTDKSKLNTRYIHEFLSNQSYWAQQVSMERVETSIENSYCVGVYKEGRQIGFARIVTDFATFGYLADVFVDEHYRGHGVSKQLMGFISALDFVRGFRRFMLGTRDAHGLYAQFGFKPIQNPDRFMEVLQTEIDLSDRNA